LKANVQANIYLTNFLLTLCSRVVNLIKYPLMPEHLNSLNVQLQNVLLLTFWLCRLVSYTCRQTHSQNSTWENNESGDRGSNRVTEKTTLVVARLQSVKNCLKQGDTLSPLLFCFGLEYATRKYPTNREGLKLNDTHQLLVYTIRSRIFCLPVCYPEICRLKYIQL
jgi:hypothetical protein